MGQAEIKVFAAKSRHSTAVAAVIRPRQPRERWHDYYSDSFATTTTTTTATRRWIRNRGPFFWLACWMFTASSSASSSSVVMAAVAAADARLLRLRRNGVPGFFFCSRSSTIIHRRGAGRTKSFSHLAVLAGGGATEGPLQLILPGDTQRTPIRHVVAPMVASSDYAFRCLCRQHYNINNNNTNNSSNNDQQEQLLTFTQMWHAKQLAERQAFLHNHWDLYEYDNDDNNDNDERLPPEYRSAARGPVIVQLAGHCPDAVVQAAQLVVERTRGRIAGIDLNLGCPQHIARRGRYGAFLHEREPELCHTILRSLRSALPPNVAVSAKIRLPLPSSISSSTSTSSPSSLLSDRILRLCDTGIDFLTVHGRTLQENKTLVRHVNVEALQQSVVVAASMGVPVIVNGGIETPSDVNQMLRDTGAAAVMSSEALLERPNLFAHCQNSDNGNNDHTTTPQQRFHEQLRLAHDYVHVWCRYAPPRPGVLGPDSGSSNIVRGHLFKILHRYWNDHPDLRRRLADAPSVPDLNHTMDLLDALRERYDDSNVPMASALDWEALSSSHVPQATWYRRHWNAIPAVTAVTTTTDTGDQDTEYRKREIRERIARLKATRQTSGLPSGPQQQQQQHL